MDYWAGWYDYSKGFPPNEMYENYIIAINDKDGKPLSVLIFPEDFRINLEKDGNYTFDK